MFKSKNKTIFFKRCAISILFFMVIFSLPTFCYSHSSDNPSFKYSREANENFDSNAYDKHEHHHHDIHVHNEDAHAHIDGHHKDENLKLKVQRTDKTEIWLYSIGSTLLISAAPFLLLFVIPLDSSDEMRPRLKVLLAFASGGLLGDAFLHLIPHATNPHHNHEHSPEDFHGHLHSHEHKNGHSHGDTHSHQHDHSKDILIGLWILVGIIVFLSVEKLVRLLKVEGNASHGHSHGKIKEKTQGKKENNKKAVKKSDKGERTKKEEVEISGYLNLAADFAHNFTDGLAIGASFLAGNSIGIVTTITILLHEVPHEIGDFAILIKSGCSRRKAMLLQLVTAVGALTGNALALIGVGTDADAAPWILPFTAGGFIYIATVSVLPELLEESTKLGQSIKEIVALLTGVALMAFIALFE